MCLKFDEFDKQSAMGSCGEAQEEGEVYGVENQAEVARGIRRVDEDARLSQRGLSSRNVALCAFHTCKLPGIPEASSQSTLSLDTCADQQGKYRANTGLRLPCLGNTGPSFHMCLMP